MGLFGPIWKRNDVEKALAWVRSEPDEKKLIRAAEESPHGKVRTVAVLKITDQAVLTRAALKDPDWDVRQSAAYRLTDQETLKLIAAQDSHIEVRKSALLRITDEAFLVAYAAQIHNDTLARYAMEHVNSQKYLALAAATSGWSGIVKNCLKKLNTPPSQEVLDILRQGRDPQVKEFLIPYESRERRAKAAVSDPDHNMREKALLTLDDPELLYQAATGDEYYSCRKAALNRLRQLKKQLPAGWWEAHITEGLADQRLPLRARAAETDPEAAKEVAGEIASGSGAALFPMVTMPVVRELEAMVSDGRKNAAKALHDLYMSDALPPALAGHAREQRKRFYSPHSDGMVDSTVCGETFRHEDYVHEETIRPL